MLRLILMRHAKSDWNHPGLRDHERPLNKRGKASAAALGDWLRAQGHLPGQVLCSSATRTADTLRGLRLDPALATQFLPSLYHAGAPVMLDALQSATAPVVLMIGHNPGICDFARRLIATPPAHDRFYDYPTGATLVCDFDAANWSDIGWASGTAVDFVIPRALLA